MMMLKAGIAGLAFVAAIVTAPSADAALLKYNLSGADQITFLLDQNTAPTRFDDFAKQKNLTFEGIKGTLLFRGRTVDVNYTVKFFQAANGGGMDLTTVDYDPDFGWEDNNYRYFSMSNIDEKSSLQLYSGSVRSPNLLTGSFALRDTFDFLGETDTYVLNVSAVPEPATWTGFILGFGLIWAAARRSRSRLVPLTID